MKYISGADFKSVPIFILSLCLISVSSPAQEALEEIRVVGVTPGSSLRQDVDKIPYAVQSAGFADLARSQSQDLGDFMNERLDSININSAQNNPLQPDVRFRGFTASPLLGLPQGIAVYQNGVRINEPLGDAVHWDLLPESAVHRMDLIGGANPIFGLNALGGALALSMKNGFNFSGHYAEGSGGAWGRLNGELEGGGNNGAWGHYLNLSHFREDGWRRLSASEATNFYGSISFRDGVRSAVDLIYQQGRSDLTGNGPLPTGMLGNRTDIFTAPDITRNNLRMINLDASHNLTDSLQLAGNVFWRENVTDTFNGDGADMKRCFFAGGDQSLLDDADEIAGDLDRELGLNLYALCGGTDPAISNLDDLETLIATAALSAGLDPADFELEDLSGDLSGTGTLADQAINNISEREQTSRGLNGQLAWRKDLFGLGNRLILGFSHLSGGSDFGSVVELATLDPATRSTMGRGVGTFIDSAATAIRTAAETYGWFFIDALELNPRLTVTISGRYDTTDIRLRDRSGKRPELNGDHAFARFNPAAGFTFNIATELNLYGSYNESSRVPTPIELSCNEGVFQLAREYANAKGEDPDDIDFECRLPNAFLADPPLYPVVTRNFEFGVRGSYATVDYHAGFFHATNSDDIIFQSTGRATGLFANVDETRRWGFEARLQGTVADKLDWHAAYSYITATFEDDFFVLSPNHPDADADGRLAVQRGDRLPGVPEHLLKIGGDYRWNDRLSVGLDAIFNSDQFIRGDEGNNLDPIDGFTVTNLRASYAVGERLTLFARVTNLFDADYENFGLLGEAPSGIVPGLADTRPIFLGIGAPRAAWAGFRALF